METYIIGASPVPEWLEDKLTPYKKMDGSCGVELYGSQRIFTLNIGDKLVKWDNGYIEIKKKKE